VRVGHTFVFFFFFFEWGFFNLWLVF